MTSNSKNLKRGLIGAAMLPLSMSVSTLAFAAPNVVIMMTYDTGWNDFGAYTRCGKALGHPTPNVDRVAKESPLHLARPTAAVGNVV